MRDDERIEVASGLMRMALALLDEGGELLAAARLQHALDSLTPMSVYPSTDHHQVDHLSRDHADQLTHQPTSDETGRATAIV